MTYAKRPHWGMNINGRKPVKYRDRDEVLNSGDAYYAPGHSTVTDVGTEWVEFSPIRELEKTNEAISRNLAAIEGNSPNPLERWTLIVERPDLAGRYSF